MKSQRFCKKRAKKHICMRHLHRTPSKEKLIYENIYLPAGNGCNAQFGFVCVGADDEHNNDNSRNYSDTANNDPADHSSASRQWRSDNSVTGNRTNRY